MFYFESKFYKFSRLKQGWSSYWIIIMFHFFSHDICLLQQQCFYKYHPCCCPVPLHHKHHPRYPWHCSDTCCIIISYGSGVCQEMLHWGSGGVREPAYSDHVGPDGGQHLQAAGLRHSSSHQGDSSVRVSNKTTVLATFFPSFRVNNRKYSFGNEEGAYDWVCSKIPSGGRIKKDCIPKVLNT